MGPHRKKKRRLKPLFWIITVALSSIIIILNMGGLLNHTNQKAITQVKPSETEQEYENFDRQIMSSKYSLVMFKSDNCIWCDKIKNEFQDLQVKNLDPELLITSVTKDRMAELFKRYGILSVPTFILFQANHILKIWVGSDKIEDVKAFFTENWKDICKTIRVDSINTISESESDLADLEQDLKTEDEFEEEEEANNQTLNDRLVNNAQTDEPIQKSIPKMTDKAQTPLKVASQKFNERFEEVCE